LIDAVAPFAAETGTAAAFVTTPKDPDINKPTIDYVATFVPKASGKDFQSACHRRYRLPGLPEEDAHRTV